MKTPPSLDSLISALRVLPGVGPKSAQRMAYHLMQRDLAGAERLARAIDHARNNLRHCARCNTFSETDTCGLCVDPARRQDLLCVVEMPADALMMEQARCFDGLYFVLMGRISPLEGQVARDIPLERLLTRVVNGGVTEVVIATNFTAEGEATAHVIQTLLKDRSIKISRIARGLPLGGELEHVDAGTLAQALYERREVAG